MIDNAANSPQIGSYKKKSLKLFSKFLFYKILQNLPLLEPRDVNISGETYSGVPTKELRFGLGGEQPEKKKILRKPAKIK